jgi:hypothetical protein
MSEPFFEDPSLYDDLLARFGTANDLSVWKQIATALINKGLALGGLDRSANENRGVR